MASDERMSFMVENARILKSNFEGREEKYNAKGERNFLLALDDDFAEQLIKDQWNVKYFEPREEGDIPQAFIQVKVRFDRLPPRIYLIAPNSRTRLDEKSVESLDWVDIDFVDLVCRGSWYDTANGSGYSAYLKSLFVNIKEDDLDRKYRINEPLEDEEEE